MDCYNFQKDQITQLQNNPTSLIDSKLTLVTEKINAESERKLKDKKALKVIIFSVPESCNSPSVYTIENAKKDLNLIQDSLGSNKLTETELNTLYRVGISKSLNCFSF